MITSEMEVIMNVLTQILARLGITDIHAYSVSPDGKRIRAYPQDIFRNPEDVEHRLRQLRFL